MRVCDEGRRTTHGIVERAMDAISYLRMVGGDWGRGQVVGRRDTGVIERHRVVAAARAVR